MGFYASDERVTLPARSSDRFRSADCRHGDAINSSHVITGACTDVINITSIGCVIDWLT